MRLWKLPCLAFGLHAHSPWSADLQSYNTYLQQSKQLPFLSNWKDGEASLWYLPGFRDLQDVALNYGKCTVASHRFIYRVNTKSDFSLTQLPPRPWVPTRLLGDGDIVTRTFYLNPTHGLEYWNLTHARPLCTVMDSQPLCVVADNTSLYVSSSNGSLVAINVATGKTRMYPNLSVIGYLGKVVMSKYLFMATTEANVVVIEVSSGRLVYQSVPLESPITSMDVVATGALYQIFLGCHDGHVRGLHWNAINDRLHTGPFTLKSYHESPIKFLRADVARVVSVDETGHVIAGSLFNSGYWFQLGPFRDVQGMDFNVRDLAVITSTSLFRWTFGPPTTPVRTTSSRKPGGGGYLVRVRK